MATLYAKSAGGNWSSAKTWSNVSSSGTDNSGPPTAATNVVLQSGSGNITIDAASVCRSLDANAYTRTVTHNAFKLSVGDGTAGVSNIALRLGASLTYASTTGSIIAFVSTSATQQTITTNGKTLADVNFENSGSWILSDALTIGSSNTLTITQGTFATGNFSMTLGAFSTSTTGTRNISLGSSAISISGLSFGVSSSTNLTWNAGTSSLTFTNVSGSTVTLTTSDQTFYDITSSNLSNLVTVGNLSCRNFTKSNPYTLSLGGTLTSTGTLSLNGTGTGASRILVTTDTYGTNRTITAASVTASYIDIWDITGAGAASWDLSAVTGGSGDCGRNSGITFTTPSTQTWSGTSGGSWSANAWTSRIPLPQDTVAFGTFTAGQTITINVPRIPGISFSGATNSPTVSTTYNGRVFCFGSLNLTGCTPSQLTLAFASASPSSITTNGNTINATILVVVPGTTFSLADNFASSNFLQHVAGTFSTANFSFSSTSFISTGTLTRTINFGSSTVTLSSSASNLFVLASSGLTFNSGTSNLTLNNTATSVCTFNGAGQTFNNVTISGDNINVYGSNTFTSLTINSAGALTGTVFEAGSTQTVSAFSTNGSSGNLVKLLSTSSGSAFSLAKTVPIITEDYMSVKDSTAIGSNWYAGGHSTDVSGNSGWIFRDPIPTREVIVNQSINRASRF